MTHFPRASHMGHLPRAPKSLSEYYRIYTHCSTLQQTTTHYSTLSPPAKNTALPLGTLNNSGDTQHTHNHTATHCNTLQHTATHTIEPSSKYIALSPNTLSISEEILLPSSSNDPQKGSTIELNCALFSFEKKAPAQGRSESSNSVISAM